MTRFLLFLFFLFPLPFFAQTKGQIKAEIITSGEVHSPVDSAKVTVFVTGGDSIINYSDSSGRCIIKPLQAGVYTMFVEKQGYQTRKINGVIVSDNKTTYITEPSGIELHPLETPPIRGIKKRKKQPH